MSTTRRTAATPLRGAPAGVPPQSARPRVTAPAPPPLRGRRRPALLGAGLVLVACGGLGTAWLVSSAGSTVSVLATAREVPQGQVVTAEDLTTVQISLDPALAVVRSEDEGDLVGRRAATSLAEGSLLTPSSTTTAVVPSDGESVVGVSLTPAQMPTEPLVAGDQVRIVSTPLAQADPTSSAPETIGAHVVSVSAPDAAGAVTVDVLLPDLQAPELAARAATGRVALVLDSRAR